LNLPDETFTEPGMGSKLNVEGPLGPGWVAAMAKSGKSSSKARIRIGIFMNLHRRAGWAGAATVLPVFR
jgi:hypothetical protein